MTCEHHHGRFCAALSGLAVLTAERLLKEALLHKRGNFVVASDAVQQIVGSAMPMQAQGSGYRVLQRQLDAAASQGQLHGAVEDVDSVGLGTLPLAAGSRFLGQSLRSFKSVRSLPVVASNDPEPAGAAERVHGLVQRVVAAPREYNVRLLAFCRAAWVPCLWCWTETERMQEASKLCDIEAPVSVVDRPRITVCAVPPSPVLSPPCRSTAADASPAAAVGDILTMASLVAIEGVHTAAHSEACTSEALQSMTPARSSTTTGIPTAAINTVGPRTGAAATDLEQDVRWLDEILDDGEISLAGGVAGDCIPQQRPAREATVKFRSGESSPRELALRLEEHGTQGGRRMQAGRSLRRLESMLVGETETARGLAVPPIPSSASLCRSRSQNYGPPQRISLFVAQATLQIDLEALGSDSQGEATKAAVSNADTARLAAAEALGLNNTAAFPRGSLVSLPATALQWRSFAAQGALLTEDQLRGSHRTPCVGGRVPASAADERQPCRRVRATRYSTFRN